MGKITQRIKNWCVEQCGGYTQKELNALLKEYQQKVMEQPVPIAVVQREIKILKSTWHLLANTEEEKDFARKEIAYELAETMLARNLINFQLQQDDVTGSYIMTGKTFVGEVVNNNL